MLLHLGPERPLYRAVFNALRHAILSERLGAGSRLPGTRTLARQLGISRNVVQAAFDQLAAEGYICSTVGSGSTVAAIPAPAVRRSAETVRGRKSAYVRRAERLMPHESPVRTVRTELPAIDFRYAAFVPDTAALRGWKQSIARAARKMHTDYPDPAGLLELRAALCTYLRRHRGVAAEPDDIIVVSGSQQALDLTARAVCDPWAVIGIEDPHYQGARQALLAAGGRLVPCAVDESGLDVGRHSRALQNARAIYVTPSHQFPTGAVMSVERRLKLLHHAMEHDTWIIEDDYDTEYQERASTIPALQALDERRCVIYIGTVVRTLSPGLRLGYVVVPRALREGFRAMKWLTDRGSSMLEQRALALFIEDGAYERAQRRAARELAKLRETFTGAMQARLGGTDVTWTGSGAHAFLRFPRLAVADVDAFIEHGVQRGVRLYSGVPYYLRSPRKAALICGFGTLSAFEIRRGVDRLAYAYGEWHRRLG